MNHVSVCIVTYNSETTIRRTLLTLQLFETDDMTYSHFLVDNESTDRTLNLVSPYKPWVHVIQSEHGNIGFGSAHNLVIPLLDSDIHIIINPDITLLDNQSIPRLVQYLNDHPDVGMVVPRIIDEQNHLQYLCRRELTFVDLALRYISGRLFQKRKDFHVMKDMNYHASFDVEFASGCMMVIRTDLFRQLGGFDESFFLYAEDADLTKRVNQVSRTVYVPDAVVCHAWERASYKHPKMALVHMKSLWRYFRKWGFRFK